MVRSRASTSERFTLPFEDIILPRYAAVSATASWDSSRGGGEGADDDKDEDEDALLFSSLIFFDRAPPTALARFFSSASSISTSSLDIEG